MDVVEKSDVAQEHRILLDRDTVLRSHKKYWFWRRMQDILLSIFGLAMLWPLMLIVAIVIVIDSPGASPIFTQIRVGRDGKEFTFYKFRSMRPNAEKELDALIPKNEMKGPVFKIKNDPRITKVGRFLRKTSIDELPQLLNVMKGDMSLVGPRPGLPREVALYDDYAKQRLYITPGLTCYWQIQKNRNSLTFDQWLEWDLKYICERSFKTDWWIIFRTFKVVFGMRGI